MTDVGSPITPSGEMVEAVDDENKLSILMNDNPKLDSIDGSSILETPNSKTDGYTTDHEDTKKNVNETLHINKHDAPKPVRKHLKEHEMLRMDVKCDLSEDFDVYVDGNRIYKKYRLRDTQKNTLKDTQKNMLTDTQKKESVLKQKVSKQTKLKQPQQNGRRGRIGLDAKKIMYDCQNCTKAFPSKTGLLNHMRMHQTVLTYTCALCFENFKSNQDLIKHKTSHAGEDRVYLCQKCKMAFTDHCDFLIHSLSHVLRTFYKCIECGLAYTRKNSYKVHIYTHYERKLRCPICSVELNGEMNLRNHVNAHKYKFECVECGKVCPSKTTHQYHLLSHTGVKPFQCLYCGKGFKNTMQRNIHTRLHTGERPFTCHICDSTFMQVTNMKRHIATHDREKKFECDHCHKKFLLKKDLVSHMYVHTKKNLYKCTECRKSYTSMAGLKTHTMYKHLSERPARCELCDTGFINNNLYLHHCKSKKHKRNEYGSILAKTKK